MERIKMKLIIAVTNKLSAAADCDAKTDLIEELSENLYERYQEYTASGMSEEAAYQKTLDELGDVDELLSYLGANRTESDWQANFSENINELCRDAMNVAQNAVKESKSFLKNLGGKLKEKYPDGFRGHIHVNVHSDDDDEFWEHYDEDEEETLALLDIEELRHITVRLLNSDLTVRVDEDATQLCVHGSLLETNVNTESGTLTVREVARRHAGGDVELILPVRHWDSIQIMGASSEIVVEGVLDADEVCIQSASGDIRLGSDGESSGVTGTLQVGTKSGEIELDGDYGAISVSTASGDIRAELVCSDFTVESVSGDVELNGTVGRFKSHTVSGDLDLNADELPAAIQVSTTSGDCRLHLPEHEGFTVTYRTTSGDFGTNFDLNGTKGKRTYLDGGTTQIELVTLSGDITIWRR